MTTESIEISDLKNKIKSEAVKYFKGLGTANAKDIEEDFGKRLVKLICDEKTNDVRTRTDDEITGICHDKDDDDEDDEDEEDIEEEDEDNEWNI
jgi:hypothetical protein